MTYIHTIEIVPDDTFAPDEFGSSDWSVLVSGFQYKAYKRLPLHKAQQIAADLKAQFAKMEGHRGRIIDRSRKVA